MIFEYGFKDFLIGFRYRIEALFYSEKVKQELRDSEKRTDYYRTLSMGPVGTEKRDEFEALASGRIPSKPLKYFSAHYRINQEEVSIYPKGETLRVEPDPLDNNF